MMMMMMMLMCIPPITMLPDPSTNTLELPCNCNDPITSVVDDNESADSTNTTDPLINAGTSIDTANRHQLINRHHMHNE